MASLFSGTSLEFILGKDHKKSYHSRGGNTMALTVFDDILNLEREIGGLFQGFAGRALPGRFLQTGERYPLMNIFDTNEDIVLVAELPGVGKEDIHLSVDDGLLTISGERKMAATPDKAQWLRNEIRTGEFSRVIELPRQVNPDKITAELSNGILRVILPKAEEAKPREVKIK
jgi:HSP20 family protein